MTKNKEVSKAYLLPLLGLVFTVLQAFTAYYTRNVDSRLNQIAVKLDETREMLIETATKLAAINERLAQTEKRLEQVTALTLNNKQEIAINKATQH